MTHVCQLNVDSIVGQQSIGGQYTIRHPVPMQLTPALHVLPTLPHHALLDDCQCTAFLVRQAAAKPPPRPGVSRRGAGRHGTLLSPCNLCNALRGVDQSTKCHSCLTSVFGVSLCSPLGGLLLVAVALAVGFWVCLSPRLHKEPPDAPPTHPALRRGVGAGYKTTCTYPCVCGCQFSCWAVGCGIERPCHLGPALPTS